MILKYPKSFVEPHKRTLFWASGDSIPDKLWTMVVKCSRLPTGEWDGGGDSGNEALT